LVTWDPHLKTAVSELEAESRETPGRLYPFKSDPGHLAVATTRLETLLGDVAVAINPQDARYKHLIGSHISLPLMESTIPIIADAYCDIAKGTGAVNITPAHDFNEFEVGRRHGLDPSNIFDEQACLNDCVPPNF